MPKRDNIQEELENLTPGFTWPDSHARLEVPEGYFQELPGRVLEMLSITGTPDITPNLPKENPYRIPEGYFEQLPGRLLGKLAPKTPVINLPRSRPRLTAWAYAAAIIVLVALSGLLWISQHHQPPTLDQQLASLSDDAIEQYLSTEAGAFNTDDVFSTLNEEDIQNSLTGGISSQDIQTYLSEEDPDSMY